MIIGYEAKRVFHNRSGLGNYGRNLIRGLHESYPELDLKLYNPWQGSIEIPLSPKVSEIRPGVQAKWYAQIWRRRLVSKQAKTDGVQIFHGLSAELPQGLSRNGIRSIVTVHDLIFLRFPHLYKTIDRKIYTRKVKSACQRADLVVAISQQTREDLIKLLGLSPLKIKVIGQGCAPEYWEDHVPKGLKLIEENNLPQKFALFVGTLEPRKNPVALAQACINQKIPLVLVGKITSYWTDYYHSLKEKDKSLIYHIQVKDTADLAGLYQVARVFAYPSDFEGFGIPLLEAMASKTALITSDNSSLKEVAGPGSILIQDNSSDSIGRALMNFWKDENSRQQATELNFNFAQQFQDAVIARQWHDTYRELLGHD